MKIYIAGKITGSPDFYEHFQRAELKLRADGHIVILPVVLPDGLDQDEYLTICFAMIEVAEGVYFLNNWKESEGAKKEYWHAINKRKVMFFEPE